MPVSSIVSVPWVMTMPSTSSAFSTSLHTGGELEPDLVIHRLAADVGDLLAGQFGDVLELRHRLDEVVHGERAGLVTGIGLRGLRAGDRATGGEDFDLGQSPAVYGARQALRR